jgi:hypothetical protein
MTEKTEQVILRSYFGLSPVCHKTDGNANAGRSQTFYCREHKKAWHAGSNVLSDWRFQTEAEQRKIWDEIGLTDFEVVEPWFDPAEAKYYFADAHDPDPDVASAELHPWSWPPSA